jgi:hypothetical protein
MLKFGFEISGQRKVSPFGSNQIGLGKKSQTERNIADLILKVAGIGHFHPSVF